ncbi:hypothetical protein GF406_15365 [candidate division KSB1 bacterium]|nr:hypothetical protein [candidate division KSB1 bacterium]
MNNSNKIHILKAMKSSQHENTALNSYFSELYGHARMQSEWFAPEPPCLRINTIKSSVQEITEFMQQKGIEFKPHPLNSRGAIILHDPLPMSHTLAFYTGSFFYQGISSQLPALALNPQPGETVLDMSAAPGSKTTQIADLMQNQGQLFSADSSFKRLQPLMTNLDRAGAMNSVVYFMIGQRWGRLLPDFFDKVLIDAPCSNLGKNPNLFLDSEKWTPARLNGHTNLQELLLISALKTVRVGGTVVYSTCSVSVEENEHLVHQVLQKTGDRVKIESIPLPLHEWLKPGLTSHGGRAFHPDLEKACRIPPFPHPVEGFFMVRLKKLDSFPVRPSDTVKMMQTRSATHPEISDYLERISQRWGIALDKLKDFRYYKTKKRIYMLAKEWQEIPEHKMIKPGIPLVEIKGRTLKLMGAAVQLLSQDINKSIIELDEKKVMQLFRTGNIHLKDQRNGYFALAIDGKIITSMSLFKGYSKIHLPHYFHLVR